jgi:predicted DsbA family dithiol-disulfide isomerase
VQAAKAQSAGAAERLDMALRLAFWRDSRCISMRHEILDVADTCPGVDVDALTMALDDGRARGQMMQTYLACREGIQGSPHFFFADGYDVHNPGVEMHQVAEPGAGFLVLDSHDPSVYREMIDRAAATAR